MVEKSKAKAKDLKRYFTGIPDKRKLWLILVGMFFLIWVSRYISMRHEMALHPDEAVFYESASSVVFDDYTFKSAKNYPGGSFVFQMPFQFAGRVVAETFRKELTPQELGRIASIFYFSVACILCSYVIYNNCQRRMRTAFFFNLIMVFSLFQIEQSRYGTGDAISFFVLAFILFTIDIFLKEEDFFYLYLSAFGAGVLTSIKFPLVFFSIYPAGALYLHTKRKASNGKSSLKGGIYFFLFVILGLVLFSPQWYFDKTFFMKAFFAEFGAYVTGANISGAGTPLNHLASLLLYQSLYSDFPLALPIAIFGVIRLKKLNKQSIEFQSTSSFYTVLVPAGLALFFIYNLFASTLYFRTYYPYYCLCAMYTAFGLSELFQKRKMQPAIVILSAFMVARGSFFVYTLQEPSQGQFIIDTLTTHEKWNERTATVILSKGFISGNAMIPQRTYIYDKMVFANGVPELLPGEFAVTGPMDFSLARKRIFPTNNETLDNEIAGWELFKQENRKYLIGQPYPTSYYYIFGAVLHGSTITDYEFPSNYIYYKDYDDRINMDKTHKYRLLYDIYNCNEYFQYVSFIDNAIIILSSLGEIQADFANEIGAWLKVPPEQYFASGHSEVLIMQSGGGSLYTQTLENSTTVSLDDFVGFDCKVRIGSRDNVITINDREYMLRENGINFVVCDKDLHCAMDWGTIVQIDSKISLKR